jgi:hypothetical protein
MSLANLNPMLAQLSRRETFGLGAATLLTLGAGGVANAAEKLVFDFKKPEDNLTAWIKLNASLESGAETCSYYSGQVIAATDPEKANVPLFGYEGFGMSRVTKLPDGRYENLHREISYYTDLKTGAVLTEWKNPMTGETVKVYPTTNDPVNSYYAPVFEQSFGEAGKSETVKIPFILPWEVFDNRAVVTFAVHTRWPSPFKKDKWPREYIGEFYKTSEMFQIHTRMSDLTDPNQKKALATGAWFKEAPFMPWMLMDNAPGRLLYNTRTFGLANKQQLPAKIREYTEKNYPLYTSAPDKWTSPNMTTFETWVNIMKPMPKKGQG